MSTDIQQKKFHGYMYPYRDQFCTVEKKIQESEQIACVQPPLPSSCTQASEQAISSKNLTFQKTDLINRRMFSTLTSRFIPFSRNTKTSSTLEPTCWPRSDNLLTT